MPLNQKKIISILVDECEDVENRCDGYRKEIFNVIAEILFAESMHRIKAINIQQKINDKCNATGQFLAKNISD
jgi:hypothetical protein